MKGVTIISENTYHGISIGNLILYFILAIAGVITVILVLNGTRKEKKPLWKSPDMIVVSLLIALIAFGAYVIIDCYKTTYTKYEVAVSDSASLNEFLDKYEIVSRDGNRYIVKEHEHN